MKEKNSVEVTLSIRPTTHGDFSVNSEISQAMKDIVRSHDYELNDVQKEALDMIVHKISRILAGNPNTKDHWHDIAGYAKLAEDRIE